jgi:acyl-coenzyme A thioesterase PaaI-like protein
MTIIESGELDVPEGFIESHRGPFSTHNGPVYHKITDEEYLHGFRVRDRHCNAHGILHGGMMMAFMDGVVGGAVWRGTDSPALTLRMTTDFVSIARPGEWVEGRGILTRATKSIAFVEGCMYSGDRTIMTASAVFKRMRKRPDRKAKG